MATPPSLDIRAEVYLENFKKDPEHTHKVMMNEIMKLRRLLCLAYSDMPYTDDGELQDNKWPPIDFNRDLVNIIEKRMADRVHNAFLKAAENHNGRT